MTRVAFVNGRYVPLKDAHVHIEDRGYQFSDGVYEVVYFKKRKFIDFEPHLDRLNKSSAIIQLPYIVQKERLRQIANELLRRTPLQEGILYLQVTRGTSSRDHVFPQNASFGEVMYLKKMSPKPFEPGIGIISFPEIRWAFPSAKTIVLLPNVLGKEKAALSGCAEALFVTKDDVVTEAMAANLFMVKQGGIWTHPATESILNGIVRQRILEFALLTNIPIYEKSFTIGELFTADEVFLTGTTTLVLPVISIDGKQISNGRPGAISRKLRTAYERYIEDACK